MKSFCVSLLCGALAAVCVALSGCGILPCDATKSVYTPGAAPVKSVAVVQRVDPCDALILTQSGQVRGSLAVPTGSVATSALLLEKTAPAEVRVGDVYEYVIT